MAPLKLTTLFLIVVCSCGRSNDVEKNESPEEIKQFQASRDLCDHFRGEEPYDTERREFLLKAMKENCTGTDEALRKLRAKYHDNRAVLESLKKYQDKIE